MNRRSFFLTLAGLPFVKLCMPKAAALSEASNITQRTATATTANSALTYSADVWRLYVAELRGPSGWTHIEGPREDVRDAVTAWFR